MTRFTRAKGSKASNERIPNEGTPWHIMKQQLEEAIAREQVTQEKTKSARQLLKEKDDDLYYAPSLGNIHTDWAEFENTKSNVDCVKTGKVEKKPKDSQKKLKKAANKTLSKQNSSSESTNVNKITESILHESKDSVGKKQKNKNDAGLENNIEDSCTKHHSNVEKKLEKPNHNSNHNPSKNKERKNKANVTNDPSSEDIVKNEQQENANDKPNTNHNTSKNKKRKRKANIASEPSSEDVKNGQQENGSDKPQNLNTKLSKRQKRNKKKQDQINEPRTESSNIVTFNVEGNDWNNSVETSKRRKFDDKPDEKFIRNDRFNNRQDKWSQFEFKNFRRFGQNVPKKFQRKVAKDKDDQEYQRRKPDNNVMKVTINGMDVEIVKYDGFPVKKEDAERLKELRQNMVMKGIPKSEIDAAMKLERRKCEKALARIRKQVCFHCRKAGHNLSDCPELEKEEVGTGICFKCGSTEHTHFECKVTKSDDYKFAKCFICREQGHIAKQCPDNPKGLYPDRGCCKICGDVTHLKKDCPDLTKEKEETSITLDTIKDSNIELLDSNITIQRQEKTPVKKIVKF